MATRIKSDYASALKDDLLSEIEARKKEGSPNFADISASSLKDELVASLELDDEHKASAPDATAEAKSGGKATPIPLVAKNPEAENGSDPCPYIPDEKFTSGVWIRASDGEEYALCIHPADGYGQTHTARNTVHQWQGRAVDFNSAFTKK